MAKSAARAASTAAAMSGSPSTRAAPMRSTAKFCGASPAGTAELNSTTSSTISPTRSSRRWTTSLQPKVK